MLKAILCFITSTIILFTDRYELIFYLQTLFRSFYSEQSFLLLNKYFLSLFLLFNMQYQRTSSIHVRHRRAIVWDFFEININIRNLKSPSRSLILSLTLFKNIPKIAENIKVLGMLTSGNCQHEVECHEKIVDFFVFGSCSHHNICQIWVR